MNDPLIVSEATNAVIVPASTMAPAAPFASSDTATQLKGG